jgi:hypothetical protein
MFQKIFIVVVGCERRGLRGEDYETRIARIARLKLPAPVVPTGLPLDLLCTHPWPYVLPGPLNLYVVQCIGSIPHDVIQHQLTSVIPFEKRLPKKLFVYRIILSSSDSSS